MLFRSVGGLNQIQKQGLATPATNPSFWNTLTAIPLDDGWARFYNDRASGTGGTFRYAWINMSQINLNPNTQYTIVTEFRNVKPNQIAQISINQTGTAEAPFTGSDLNVSSGSIINGNSTRNTRTTIGTFTSATVGLRLLTSTNIGQTTDFEMRVMIIEGDYTSTSIPYHDYIPPVNHHVDLTGFGSLNSLTDDTTDTTDTQYTKEYTITGNEGIAIRPTSPDDYVDFTIQISGIYNYSYASPANMYCNRLPIVSSQEQWTLSKDSISASVTGVQIRLSRQTMSIPAGITVDIGIVKAFLQAYPIKILYRLAIPVQRTVPIPQMTSNLWATRISVIDDVGASNIKADVKVEITRLFSVDAFVNLPDNTGQVTKLIRISERVANQLSPSDIYTAQLKNYSILIGG